MSSLPAPTDPIYPATSARYRAIATRIWALIRQRTGVERHQEPQVTLRALASYRSELAPASWRLYRAALVFSLGEQGPDELIAPVAALDVGPCHHGSANTSTKKRKTIASERLEELATYIEQRGSRYAKLAYIWLRLGLLTGLRPCEWEFAKCDEQTLVVRNAKHSQGRTFAPERKLDLRSLEPEDRASVAEFLSLVGAQEDFSALYANCRCALLRVNRALWPRASTHITLYSGRHQFAANLKAANFDLSTIAAAMGHSSILTASRHYANRRYGYVRSGRVRPSAEDVLKVRALNANASPRTEFTFQAHHPNADKHR